MKKRRLGTRSHDDMKKIIFIILICTIVCLGCSGKTSGTEIDAGEVSGPIYNEDGSVTLSEGSVSYGFYDLETDRIINSGTTIEVSGEALNGRVSFHQNYSVERSYLLIILIDYMQHEFYAEGQEVRSYPFQLEGESGMNLDISVPLAETEGQEFAFMAVSEPDRKTYLIEGQYDWDTMFKDREPSIARYNLSRENFQGKKEQKYPENYESFLAEMNTTGFELVRSRDEMTAYVEGKGGEELNLVILNQAERAEETTYAVTAFAGWEQVPVDGENMKCYVTVPSGASVYIPVMLPEVTEPMPFQIFAFSGPDKILDRYTWNNPATFRVIVMP